MPHQTNLEHVCKNCNGKYWCKRSSQCMFGIEVPNCPACYKMFDPDKTFVQMYPDSKYDPNNRLLHDKKAGEVMAEEVSKALEDIDSTKRNAK